ncbi:MAG TPA: hypothetical protein PLI43_03930 [Albidovulum sp.]|uniref:hypothetical protein n=1 Tax=Albidovulum sp. TaxID=1872424 RepID=UPI002BB05882|nr:hypothetical protein [Albidovulum sp.]
MIEERLEAEVIARLLAADRKRAVGLVYLWNTGELSLLWTGQRSAASFLEPLCHLEILMKAKSAAAAETTAFLDSLVLHGGPDGQC